MARKERKHRPGTGFSLQRRFLFGLALILLLFCVVSSYLFYLQERKLLEETAYTKSELVMQAVEASRHYVREVLRPKMYEVLGNDTFILEAMSTSYVGRAIMDRFNQSMPFYQYRRAAVDARNPASEANPVERDMIEYFQKTKAQEWHGILRVDGQAHFMRFKPVYFAESCMHCHGKPEDAPPRLLSLYGAKRGFGRKPGQLAGVVAVSVPVDIALAQTKEIAWTIFWIGFLCVLFLFAAISFFFDRIVVHNLRDILAIFHEGLSEDHEFDPIPEEDEGDEIRNLNEAAHRMVERLRETRHELEAHMESLEAIVDERTRALQESQKQLREKVAARNRELRTLNAIAELTTQSQRLSDILPVVLEKTLDLIPAQGAALYLLKEEPSRLELTYHKNAPHLITSIPFNPECCELPPEDDELDFGGALSEAACGRMSFYDGENDEQYLSVPLCCRGVVLGVMTFCGVDFEEMTGELHDLLFSIGRQVGIALDSLRNLEALVQSKELLQTVFDGITDVVLFIDKDRRIRMVNKAYLDRKGTDLEKVLGRRCRDLMDPQLCVCTQCSLDRVFETGTPVLEEVTNDLGHIYQVSFYPLVSDRGHVEGVIRYVRDITEHKRIEQRIFQAEKMASLGQLAAGVAHEINNPLGVILCYTDLLRRQLADFPTGLKDVETIEKHAMNCKRIVSDLLKLARGQETARRLVSLNKTVEEVVDVVRGQFRRRRIEIRLELTENLPLVEVDVDKLKQVYLNLLMNAQQAINGRGLIRIQTRYLEKADQAEVVFWDNGRGIPPDILDRIFDPFFSTKATGEGTGLGLSVSYRIIKDHGGDIFAESRFGEWTRFIIRLPVAGSGLQRQKGAA